MTHTQDAAKALRQASEWRLLSMLFSRPAGAWRRDLGSAADECEDPELRTACAAALEQASERAYDSIFGPGGPAAPREASYRTTLQLGYLLAEIEAHYKAFGYQPDPQEPADHVAVETDFLSFLKAKEALAVAAGRPEEADVACQAAKSFLAEHLRMLAEPLCRSLENSGLDYLRSASQRLLGIAGPRPALQGDEPTADLVQIDSASFSCGTSA